MYVCMIYIYIYIYVYLYLSLSIYIYIYIEREREREMEGGEGLRTISPRGAAAMFVPPTCDSHLPCIVYRERECFTLVSNTFDITMSIRISSID